MAAVRKPRADENRRKPERSRPGPNRAIPDGPGGADGSPVRDLQAQLHQEFSSAPMRVWSRYVTPFLVLVMLKAWLVGQTLYTPGLANTVATFG